MAEENTNTTEAAGEERSGEKIMCFVSKQMVAIEDTVEVEYQGHKKVRVLPKYIKYE